MLSLVFVFIIHIRSDASLKIMFVFSLSTISIPLLDFVPLRGFYKQTIFLLDQIS